MTIASKIANFLLCGKKYKVPNTPKNTPQLYQEPNISIRVLLIKPEGDLVNLYTSNIYSSSAEPYSRVEKLPVKTELDHVHVRLADDIEFNIRFDPIIISKNELVQTLVCKI